MNQNQIFEIIPNTGVNSLKFGMSERDVHDSMGIPTKMLTSYGGNRIAVYGVFSIIYDRTSKTLSEVSFSPGVQVVLNGINLFDDTNVLDELIEFDSNPMYLHGSIVYYDLGISLSGFNFASDETKVIVVFKPGYWDEFKSKGTLYLKHCP